MSNRSNKLYNDYRRGVLRRKQQYEHKMSTCPRCGQAFKSEETYRAHYKETHR